jgi:hypothetical protein
MRLKTIAIILGVCVVTATLGLCWYAGMFDRVSLFEDTAGPYNFVYREHTGPSDGMKYVIGDVYAFLRYKKNMAPEKGFAIFYEKPSTARKDSLRYIGGAITDSLLSGLKTPYFTRRYEPTWSVIGTFPMRSFMSYSIGIVKFQPRLERYLASHGLVRSGPILQIFDMNRKQIQYIAPLSR